MRVAFQCTYSITFLCNVFTLHIMNMQFRNFRAARLTSVIYIKKSTWQTWRYSTQQPAVFTLSHLTSLQYFKYEYNINIFGVPVSTTKCFSTLNFQDKLIQQFRHRFPKWSLQERKFPETTAFARLQNLTEPARINGDVNHNNSLTCCPQETLCWR